jgi:hypothetical protein
MIRHYTISFVCHHSPLEHAVSPGITGSTKEASAPRASRKLLNAATEDIVKRPSHGSRASTGPESVARQRPADIDLARQPRHDRSQTEHTDHLASASQRPSLSKSAPRKVPTVVPYSGRGCRGLRRSSQLAEVRDRPFSARLLLAVLSGYNADR